MKKFAVIAALVIIAALAFGYQKANGLARIGAGYSAKITCSEVFIAKRDPEKVKAAEFNNIDPMLANIKIRVDQKTKSVHASLFGLGKSTAIYRDDYGCTLIVGGTPETLADLPVILPLTLPNAKNSNQRVDYPTLNTLLENAIKDEIADHRALLVMVDGAIVAETYAEGFSAETPFLSWSMAKSIIATLVAAAELQGLINLDDTPPVPEWADNKKKSTITWRNLLRMQSSLEFGEFYEDPTSDVIRMLHNTRDTGGIAAEKKPLDAPGEIWNYSSGTTNLIARSLRYVLEKNGGNFYAFAQESLLRPLGASSVIMEPDSSGTIIGSSYIYATTHDWAKFGQLYLQDGNWNGTRLFPESWNKFVATPSGKSDHQYGAHFWLNQDGAGERKRFLPGLPNTAYMMAGHDGQYVIIVPDKRMIIVRTGLTRQAEPMEIMGPITAGIYDAIAATE